MSLSLSPSHFLSLLLSASLFHPPSPASLSLHAPSLYGDQGTGFWASERESEALSHGGDVSAVAAERSVLHGQPGSPGTPEHQALGVTAMTRSHRSVTSIRNMSERCPRFSHVPQQGDSPPPNGEGEFTTISTLVRSQHIRRLFPDD